MKNLFLILVIPLIISCGKSGESNSGSIPMAEYDAISKKTEEVQNSGNPDLNVLEEKGTDQTSVNSKKKIIKDGRMGLRVKNLENSKQKIDALIKKYNGYVANENFNNTDYESSFNLKIRIPSLVFDGFIDEIEKGNEEVTFKSIDARDVTEQFIDLETRLKNKKNYLVRYGELLKQAKSVEEILQIEEKIRGLEEEIESTEGKLKYLSDQVSFSTLDLTISKEKDFQFNPGKRLNFFERLKQSLSKGWYGFVSFILFIFRLWPFLILAVVGFFTYRKYKNSKLNRKK
jgi:nitrate reductase NapE component